MDAAEGSGQVRREEVQRWPIAKQDRETLAHLIDYGANRFELGLYELASD